MSTSQEMEMQFNRIASEYDAARRKFIPCFDVFYDDAAEYAAAGMNPPARILDLGAGTGLLTMRYYRLFPQAEFLLSDLASSMLDVARERFRGIQNIAYSLSDYDDALPPGPFDLIVSALSIHHLEDDRKRNLFERIRKELTPGGMFVNHDQFRGDTPETSERYDRHWLKQIHRAGLSGEDLAKWRERRKLDRECSVSMELAMLKSAGFHTADRVCDCRKFAVLTARTSESIKSH